MLVCHPTGAVWPATIMINKATCTTAPHERLTWGAAQLGIGQGVLDAVAEQLLAADQDTILLVTVWVSPEATDATAIRTTSRHATLAAIRRALTGPTAHDVAAQLAGRETAANAFYDGT